MIFDIVASKKFGMDNNPRPQDYRGERQSRLADRRIRFSSGIRPSRCQGTSRHIELELLPVHLWEETHSPLGRIMFQRVRTAGRVLPGNLPKIHSQGLPSFLYASKRCSSRSDHRLCLLVLECPCSSSLGHPSSSLLGSGSLSLKPPSSSLLDGYSLAIQEPRHPRLLPGWGWIQQGYRAISAVTSRGCHLSVERGTPNAHRRFECGLFELLWHWE
jgi:hypothetical protein